MRYNKGIMISILIILLVFVSTVAATYSVIISVASNEGVNEIVNDISIRDLVYDSNGMYNETYYSVKRELLVNDKEAEILISSVELNNALKIVLERIVDYKVNNNINSKIEGEWLYNLIVDSVKRDNNIDSNIRDRVIIKSKKYINDIINFLDEIDISVIQK